MRIRCIYPEVGQSAAVGFVDDLDQSAGSLTLGEAELLNRADFARIFGIRFRRRGLVDLDDNPNQADWERHIQDIFARSNPLLQ